ncbi:thiamine-phosphate kinase [Kibdelosporangium philippinense]|uniref:Thiamine-monophosphate kinase n=1 Tax=Kibdelosporangium philippinense TaxID=211113 RepID=A0ABS8ZPN6_9PSEU|nr:thiamine-phosphate kinase [Kibdelosporangium philippinense]MCE7008591.1 thiamine-phosphate kinase [Kibdelosporangium philippinense]
MRRRHSDEPTRLAEYIAKIFRLDTGTNEVEVAPGTSARTVFGADAQDDCAVVRMTGEQDLVVGTDYVRGPKFRLYEMGHLSLFDLGYYLVAANVSDVAAMGARPLGLLSVVRYPPDMPDDDFLQVLAGIRAAASDFRCPSIGGDIGSAERLFLSATALGVCPPGKALLRNGARPGDVLCLTGPTGTAGAAMAYLRSGLEHAEIEREHREVLLSSWQRPRAKVAEGALLGDSGVVTSCQDTSDGLKAAVHGIADASGVGFVIDQARIPVAAEVRAVCKFLGTDLMATVMGDSVDFQLVFTAPRDELSRLGLEIHPIGVATRERSVVLAGAGARRSELPGAAWRHVDEAQQGKGD